MYLNSNSMKVNTKNVNSNRSFGIVFFFVFLIIGLWPTFNGLEIRFWSIILSIIFLFLGLKNSIILFPLNVLWFKFGILLGRTIAPLIMGIIYFLVVFPTFLFLRIFKKNYLDIKYEKSKYTYWKNVENYKSKMKDQF